MSSMKKFGCKSCGSYHVRERDGKLYCVSCGAFFTLESETNEERDARILFLSRLDDAEKCLRISPPRFDDAEDMYRDFIKQYPDSSDGYWGLVRAKYGIKYETDISGREIPSCYKASYEDFRKDSDFLRALDLAESENLSDKYFDQAKLISGVCREWREEASKYSYDIFISFKATDDATGEETEDSREMTELYNDLRDEGYDVFFSPKSMKKYSGKHYDAYIFNALQMAKVMIVYGSKPEYFTSTWVQNEWTRFLRMQAKGEKKNDSCIVAYRKITPKDLPRDLRRIQALDAEDKKFYTELIKCLKNAMADEVKVDENAELRRQLDELKRQIEADRKRENDEKARIEAEEARRAEKARKPEESKKRSAEDFEIEDGSLIQYKGNAKIVEIPDGVSEISDTAFEHCNFINQIIIPESVTNILSDAFNDCSALTEIIVHKSNKHFSAIDGHLYDKTGKILLRYVIGKKEEQFIIPNGVTRLGDNAFSHTSTIKNVEIPNSVTSIGYAAFFGCNRLAKIKIPDSVVEIGNEAFTFCSELCEVALPKKLKQVGAVSGDKNQRMLINLQQGVFSYCKKLTKIEIPEGVTSIGDWTFKGCTSLSEVVIPNGLKSIGDGAFERCSALETINLPDSVERIGHNGFYNCSALNGLYITNLSKWCQIEFETLDSNPLYRAENLYLNGELVTRLRIPEDVTEINQFAFAGCRSMDELTVAEGVCNIDLNAFYDCGNLKTVYLPTTVKHIGNNAFEDCENLTTIYYSGSEEEWVAVEKADERLEDESITVEFQKSNETEYAERQQLMQECARDCIIKNGCLKKYNGSAEKIFIPDSVTSIGYEAFSFCKSLTKIVIPDSVTSIGSQAFKGCSSLINIVIPDSVTSIGNQAFSGCSSLINIVIPDSVTSIGNWAFRYCESLTEIVIPNGVIGVGESAFEDCYIKIYVENPRNIKKWDKEWNRALYNPYYIYHKVYDKKTGKELKRNIFGYYV